MGTASATDLGVIKPPPRETIRSYGRQRSTSRRSSRLRAERVTRLRTHYLPSFRRPPTSRPTQKAETASPKMNRTSPQRSESPPNPGVSVVFLSGTSANHPNETTGCNADHTRLKTPAPRVVMPTTGITRRSNRPRLDELSPKSLFTIEA